MRKFMILVGTLSTLTSCQSAYVYQPIVPNPVQLDMANARCELMSSSAQQGMVAWGSAEYVAGAQIGNAIGNAIRVDQFIRQCMVLQGWKRVSKDEVAARPMPSSAEMAVKVQQNVNDMMFAEYAAAQCGISIASEKLRTIEAIKKSDPRLAASGKSHGRKLFADAVKRIGKPFACNAAKTTMRDMHWID